MILTHDDLGGLSDQALERIVNFTRKHTAYFPPGTADAIIRTREDPSSTVRVYGLGASVRFLVLITDRFTLADSELDKSRINAYNKEAGV